MQYGKQFWTEKLGTEWALRLKHILKSEYSKKLMRFIDTEYAMQDCQPVKADMFQAFKLCPWDSVRIVIVDYKPHTHCYGANGLAFGDKFDCQFQSPALGKIYDCIEREYYDGLNLNFDTTLESWAKQGVLLLNRQLTTRVNDNGEHTKPWGKFISEVLNTMNEYKPGTIYFLWGKGNYVLKLHLEKNNYVLTFDHPSDFIYPSKDWHCPNFKEADEILYKLNKEKIEW